MDTSHLWRVLPKKIETLRHQMQEADRLLAEYNAAYHREKIESNQEENLLSWLGNTSFSIKRLAEEIEQFEAWLRDNSPGTNGVGR